MNNNNIVFEATARYNIYDRVFFDYFTFENNLSKLYHTLIGDASNKNLTKDSIKLLNSEKVLVNNLYNDLGFVIDNNLIILAEAQSTYSKNIATRLLFYVSNSLKIYLRNQHPERKLTRLYRDTVVKIPKIKLFTVYTGKRKMQNHEIRLSDLMQDEHEMLESDLDLKVKVICVPEKDNVLGEYINFCRVIREQKKLGKSRKDVIRDAIKIYIDRDIMRKYLKKKEYEVIKMYAHAFADITEEDLIKMWKEEGLEQGKKEIALEMLKSGMEIALVNKYTGLNQSKLLELKKQL